MQHWCAYMTLENAVSLTPRIEVTTPCALPCMSPLKIQPYTTAQAKAGELFLWNAPETAIEADGQIVSIAALPELFECIGHNHTPRKVIGFAFDPCEEIAFKAGWGKAPVERALYQWQHPPQGSFYLPSLLTI